jgi:hypothetical protein
VDASRPPGSDAERRAANELRGRLGPESAIEPFDTWPRWRLAYALHATVAVVGSVLSTSIPAAGAALVLLAAVLTYLDATGTAATTRRLLGRRASQNVVSAAPGRPVSIVVAAHYDTGHATRIRLLFGALLGTLACTMLRLAALDGVVLTAIQFAFTVGLLVAILLLFDAKRRDAPGIDTALRLASDCDVVLLGAQTAQGDGLRAFTRRHRPDAVVVIGGLGHEPLLGTKAHEADTEQEARDLLERLLSE